jgi:hypothetical protein
MFINKINSLLNSFKMAQFCYAIFGKTLILPKTVFDFGKVIEKQLLKSLQLNDINTFKEIINVALIAQNVFEIKVFLNVALQQA